MTYFDGYVDFSPQHRLFPQLNSLLIMTASLSVSVQLHIQGNVSYRDRDFMTVQANVHSVQIRLPLYGVIERAFASKLPDGISLFFEKKSATSFPSPKTTSGLREVVLLAISPLFVEFYERARPWLKQNIGNSAKWPPVLDFGRAVRNACSHGGKLHMTTTSPRPVSWHHLHYDLAQHGKQIIGTDLALGDLLILMIEMADELDRIGCPA